MTLSNVKGTKYSIDVQVADTPKGRAASAEPAEPSTPPAPRVQPTSGELTVGSPDLAELAAGALEAELGSKPNILCPIAQVPVVVNESIVCDLYTGNGGTVTLLSRSPRWTAPSTALTLRFSSHPSSVSSEGVRDPFDRMLVGQAQAEGVTLLTADERLAAYGSPVWIRSSDLIHTDREPPRTLHRGLSQKSCGTSCYGSTTPRSTVRTRTGAGAGRSAGSRSRSCIRSRFRSVRG